MAAYKYPRIVEFVDSLPMTATGKILKRELSLTGPGLGPGVTRVVRYGANGSAARRAARRAARGRRRRALCSTSTSYFVATTLVTEEKSRWPRVAA